MGIALVLLIIIGVIIAAIIKLPPTVEKPVAVLIEVKELPPTCGEYFLLILALLILVSVGGGALLGR